MRNLIRHVLNLAFPPVCPSCTAAVMEHGNLCANCWSGLHFVQTPQCACCGLPFDVSLPDGTECGSCMTERPKFDRMRAALRYDEGSKPLVFAFKYNDKTLLTELFARWMTQAGKEVLNEADVMVPVPVHWRRMLKRRYNQAALLCYALAKQLQVPVQPELLARVRYTPPQASLSGRAARQKNVRGVFTVKAKYKPALQGKHVLLVDDVYTTGATIHACVRMLKRSGAAKVSVLTLARTV